MNPNAPRQPYAPAYPQYARAQMGGHNPYGYGKERVAGKLALQRNVPGLPTNTVPLPQMRQPRMMRPNYHQMLGRY